MTPREAAAKAIAKLPNAIRIAGFDITLQIVPVLESHALNQWGSFSALTQTIQIQAVMPSVYKVIDTLFHKIHHAICWCYDIQDDDKEERVASLMGTVWLQIYRDNPWLARWVLSELHGEK